METIASGVVQNNPGLGDFKSERGLREREPIEREDSSEMCITLRLILTVDNRG